MASTVDGFPLKNPKLAMFLSNLKLNDWSNDKKVQIPVADFYFNPGKVTSGDKTIEVADRELFIGMIKGWCSGTKLSPGMKKQEALELAFEMA